MELWYPRAKQDLFASAGKFNTPLPWRGVLHTMEGGYAGSRKVYATGVAPQFSVEGSQVYQHMPLNEVGKALVNAHGGVETNRDNAVQIEVAGFAAKAWDDVTINTTRDLMIWIEQQTGILPIAPKFLPYPASYGAGNGVRFTNAQWEQFHGWCGHMHVPENLHGDPGALPIQQLLTRFPVPPPAVNTKEVTGVRITTGVIGPRNLDKDGHGWVSIPCSLDRLMFLEERGSAPARDGGYWNLLNHDVNDSGAEVIVTLYGAPNEEVYVYYKVLEEV